MDAEEPQRQLIAVEDSLLAAFESEMYQRIHLHSQEAHRENLRK